MAAGKGPHHQYAPPRVVSEPAGAQLGAFGITTIPGQRVTVTDPAKSPSQQRLFGLCSHGSQAAVCRKLHKTMTAEQIREFARNP